MFLRNLKRNMQRLINFNNNTHVFFVLLGGDQIKLFINNYKEHSVPLCQE